VKGGERRATIRREEEFADYHIRKRRNPRFIFGEGRRGTRSNRGRTKPRRPPGPRAKRKGSATTFIKQGGKKRKEEKDSAPTGGPHGKKGKPEPWQDKRGANFPSFPCRKRRKGGKKRSRSRKNAFAARILSEEKGSPFREGIKSTFARRR